MTRGRQGPRAPTNGEIQREFERETTGKKKKRKGPPKQMKAKLQLISTFKPRR